VNQFTASLWGDEAWAATLAVQPILKIIQIVARDTSPPFYYLLLHPWMRIFGTSEAAIRSLSFLFFLGTILTVFLIGNYFWGRKTGVLTALLAFTNPFLFTYAFEGRMYALLALTSTLSIYFFLKKHRLGFILASTVALYTHHFSIFIIFFEGFWRLVHIWKQPLKKILKSFSDFFIIGLLYLPWFYPLYYQTSLVASGFWLGRPTLEVFKETVQKFIVGSGTETSRQVAWWLIIVTLILRNWLEDKKQSLFLLGWFFTPLILTFFISQFFQPIFFDRYMLMVIPASSLLIASLRRKFSFVFILATLFLLATINYRYFLHPSKRPFRELAGYIKTEAQNLTIINYNAAAHHLWESKYYGLKAPIYAPGSLPFYTGTALMEGKDTISQLPDEEKIGLITSANPSEVKVPGYSIETTKKFDSLYFLWLKRD
jgi:4-amino-4-deoxy-L-arabinose transferase-like glycosyltransferase